jgi:hypothetical protein
MISWAEFSRNYPFKQADLLFSGWLFQAQKRNIVYCTEQKIIVIRYLKLSYINNPCEARGFFDIN